MTTHPPAPTSLRVSLSTPNRPAASFDLYKAACSSQMRLASNNHLQSPRVKASNCVTNFSLDMTPPPGGRCNNNLGNSKKTFHPRVTWTSSTLAMISSRTIFIAFRKGPCKKRGTDLITDALNEKMRSTTTSSIFVKACLNAGALGTATSAGSSASVAVSSTHGTSNTFHVGRFQITVTVYVIVRHRHHHRRSSVIGHRSSVIGHQSSVIGHRSSSFVIVIVLSKSRAILLKPHEFFKEDGVANLRSEMETHGSSPARPERVTSA